MHYIFSLMRFYPYWALSFSLVLFELGIFFRRREQSVQWSCFAMVVFFAATAVLWFVFRGDVHSDQWVRWVFGM